MTSPIQHTAPADLADEMLAAVARAERAEASLGLAREDLRFANAATATAARQRDKLTEQLEAVKKFHDTWGDTEDADGLALWEDLGRILGAWT